MDKRDQMYRDEFSGDLLARAYGGFAADPELALDLATLAGDIDRRARGDRSVKLAPLARAITEDTRLSRVRGVSKRRKIGVRQERRRGTRISGGPGNTAREL